MVTVREALAVAKKALVQYGHKDSYHSCGAEVCKLAAFVVDTFGPALECGYESPVVNHHFDPPRVDIPEAIGIPVEDARTIAAAILRECDVAYEERM